VREIFPQSPPAFACSVPQTAFVQATITDNVGVTGASFTYSFKNQAGQGFSGTIGMKPIGNNIYRGVIGPFPYSDTKGVQTLISISVNAHDAARNQATPGTLFMVLGPCG